MVRFEDRTRWAPLCYIADNDSRPVAYKLQPITCKEVSRLTTSFLFRLIRTPGPASK